MTKISVVTLSFNQNRFLGRCLTSVSRQKGDFELEHIIVDPGSTDGSREAILDYASRTTARLILEPDDGPADGLNKGLDAVTGDIWIYLNADDELAPGALQKLVALHARWRESILYGNGWIIDEKGTPVRFVRSDEFHPRRYVMDVAVVLQQATSFKRDVIASGLRFRAENRLFWDTQLLMDAALSGITMRRVDATIGYFRMYGTSITGSGSHKTPAYRAATTALRKDLIPNAWVRVPLRALAPAARVWKKAKGIAREGFRPEAFPGLVSAE